MSRSRRWTIPGRSGSLPGRTGSAEVMQDRVDQGPARVPRAGVNDHARGLVDDQQRRVFVDDRQRDRLGSGVGERWRGDRDQLDLARGVELVRGLDRLAGDPDLASGEAAGQLRAGHRLALANQRVDQRLVEALADGGLPEGDADYQMLESRLAIVLMTRSTIARSK